MFGYMGRLLYVDLGKRSFYEEILEEDIARKHIGGSGLSAYIINKKYQIANINALDPQNPLIFTTGPLVGTMAPSSGRFAVAAKSPLTGIWGESDCGSRWGIALKSAGYDGLIITGKADKPTYLFISDSLIEFCDATDLWGTDTYEVYDKLTQKHSNKSSVVCIGPAGERQILMASIMAEGSHGRAAGRCGLGAVMGSKNLKAIVARGSQKTKVAHPEDLKQSVRRAVPGILSKTQRVKKLGTAGGVVGNATLSDMSAKNWTNGNWIEGAERISGEKIAENYLVKDYHCPSCVVGCGKVAKIPQGKYKGTVAGSPEYETLAGFGAQLLNDDLASIMEANDLCNRFGIDTISLSGTIAFLFEAVEKGYLKVPEGYPELNWGNGEAIIFLINETINQQGLGKLIGLGVKRLSEYLGTETKKFAIHVKGLEFPYHDPRALSSLAVAYATYPRGACHRGCSHNIERTAFPQLGYPSALDRHAIVGKGRSTAIMQNYAELFNCLKMCSVIMGSLQPSDILEWLNAVTGWDMDLKEFLEIGERNINLKRLINIKCGMKPEDDTLPERILKEAFTDGNSANFLPDLPLMLKEYYQFRGWDENGKPSNATLIRLGLAERT